MKRCSAVRPRIAAACMLKPPIFNLTAVLPCLPALGCHHVGRTAPVHVRSRQHAGSGSQGRPLSFTLDEIEALTAFTLTSCAHDAVCPNSLAQNDPKCQNGGRLHANNSTMEGEEYYANCAYCDCPHGWGGADCSGAMHFDGNLNASCCANVPQKLFHRYRTTFLSKIPGRKPLGRHSSISYPLRDPLDSSNVTSESPWYGLVYAGTFE